MSCHRHFLGIGLAVLIVLIAGCGSFEHGSVRGYVLDATDGSPVQGAVIAIGSEHGVTGVDGFYNISGIRTGQKQMLVKLDGYYLPGDVVMVNVIKGVIDLPELGLLPVGEVAPPAPAL